MKKRATFISLFLLIFCNGHSQERKIEQIMVVEGTIKNASDGTKVFLVIKDSNYKTHIDSVVIKNQRFIFKKEIKEPSEAVILTDSTKSIRDPNKFRIFYTENATLNFNATYDQMFDAIIKGGTLNKDYDIYHKTINQLYYQTLQQYMIEMQKPTFSNRPDSKSIRLKADSVKELITLREIQYVKKFTNSYKSAQTLISLVKDKSLTKDSAKAILSNFAPIIKLSSWGILAQDLLMNLKAIEVGNYVPEIYGEDILTKKQIHIKDFSGKYVLINFWASWCGPCRGNHKYLNKLYSSYKTKNFEIIGISLDTNKEALMNAIKKDNVEWITLTDYKGWNSDFALAFGVGGIPMDILIDPEGKILSTQAIGSPLSNLKHNLK